MGAGALLGDLELDAEQIERRRDDGEVRHARFGDGALQVRVAGQDVIGRQPTLPAVEAEPGRSVALRIEIDDQDVLADRRQRRAEVDGSRGLADASLLVGESEDPRAGRFCSGRRESVARHVSRAV